MNRVEHAESLLETAMQSPRETLDGARALLAEAQHAGDAAAATLAARAAGLAARELHDIDASIDHLTSAREIATASGAADLAAKASLSLSGSFAMAGRFDDATHAITEALDHLEGFDAAVAQMQAGTIAMVRGRYGEALESFDQALPRIRREDHHDRLATLYANRGFCLLQMGKARRAARDLEQAHRRYLDVGQSRAAADVASNLGLAASFQGDTPQALRWFDRATELLTAVEATDGIGMLDRGRVLADANLLDEAAIAFERAIAQLERDGLDAWVAEALLARSDIHLAADDPTAALATARQAAELFREQDRANHRLIAEARAATADARAEPSLLAASTLLEVAAALDAAAIPSDAAQAWFDAGDALLALGDHAAAERAWRSLARYRSRGPLSLQLLAWRAAALIRHARGDTAGAGRALHAGIRRVIDHQTGLGSRELRVQAAGHATAFNELGLVMARDAGSAGAMFDWAERSRATNLRLLGSGGIRDQRLSDMLAELRATAHQIEVAAREDDPTGPLLAHQADLERAIRSHSRRTGVDRHLEIDAVSLDEVAAQIGEGALVQICGVDGSAYAICVTSQGVTMHTLGPSGGFADLAAGLTMAVHRLAVGVGSAPSLEAARMLAGATAADLDEMLGSVRGILAGREQVLLVPGGSLLATPWAALPSLADLNLSVNPSATTALRSMTAPHDLSRVAVVAGPDLDHAEAEARAVAAVHPGSDVLIGDGATAQAMLAAFLSSDLVHVAAHGSFRADNPAFSSIRAADGPVTVHDIEMLPRSAGTVVLSACNTGLSAIAAGEELTGLVAGFSAVGTHTMLASSTPVPDALATSVMTEVHQHIVRGRSASSSLRRALGSLPDDERLVASTFLSIGGA